MGVTFGLFEGGEEVAVALVRGRGHPEVGVEAHIDEDHAVVAFLDLSPGARPTIGELLRIRLGLPEPRRGALTIPWLRVGDLLVTELVVREVPGDALTLTIPEGAAVAVLPSRGQVRFVPAAAADALLDTVGARTAWTLPAGPAGLPWTDLAVDPASAAMASAPALHPTWTDADQLRATHLEALLRPVEREDFLGRLRWGEYAAIRYVLGESTELADENLLRAAGTDCRSLLAVGERRVRVGDLSAQEPLDVVRRQWQLWLVLPPAARARARGTPTEVHPDCARAVLLAPGAEGRFDRDDPLETARHALDTASVPAARFALANGVELPGLRVLLGQPPPGPDPHPLTTALLLGDAAPDGLAAQVVAGVADLDDVTAWLLGHPGDPAATCLLAAATPPAEVPDHPEADCLAARIVRARLAGGDDGEAWKRLRERWPDVVPAGP